MKLFTLTLAAIALFLVNETNESGNNIEPDNTYKHPYYEHYINYIDLPSVPKTDSLSSEGC